jgi:effector-binding domain-containing protein
MKILKIIGIIVGIIVAAILIVPLFAPSTAEVSVSTEISLEPGQIFPSVASFSHRAEWDPWLATDTTAESTFHSEPGYVGSTYSWEGDALGTGRMEVISVEEDESIESNLWFGDAKEPSHIHWDFEQVDGGTQATWTFSQDTKYPFGRLGMMIGAGFLKKSMEDGLARLKEYLEAHPPQVDPLGPISVTTIDAFDAMVAGGGGTSEEISQVIGDIYVKVLTAIRGQGLEISGPAFAQYLSWDETTGYSDFVAGFPVAGAGKSGGGVEARHFPEMKVIGALHTGSYDLFMDSYNKLEKYIEDNGIEIAGSVFEFYKVGMYQDPDPAHWQTEIAFPMK